MSEKTIPRASDCAQHASNIQPSMSSHRALLTLAAFLAFPLGFVYVMSHCNHFAPSTTSLSQYESNYRHPHATTRARQSMLECIGKLITEASRSPLDQHMQIRFCAGEDLRDCTAYGDDQGCTKIKDERISIIAEPGMFEGVYSACTVYRRGVQDCSVKEEGSFQHVKQFVVNWYMEN